MPHISLISSALLLTPVVLAGQQNPFALTGGSVKTAYIVYDVKPKAKPQVKQDITTKPVSFELGVAPDRWMFKMVAIIAAAGQQDTLKAFTASAGDSQFTYTSWGREKGEGEVTRILRPHLAREYAALNAAAKARFLDNVKLATNSSASGSGKENLEQLITLTGEKKGSETIAGRTCDVYQRGTQNACVLPEAPMVILRWTDDKQGYTMVAKKITLNKPIPPAAAILPKGVQWKKSGYDTDEFAPAIWSRKKDTDPSTVPPATLAKFAVSYLASPQASQELKGQGEPAEETGEAEEPSDSNES